MDPTTEANLARRTADERHTVRVELLVNRGRARGRASHGDAGLLGVLSDNLVVTLAEILDDRGLHRELDEIEGEEPNDVL